MYYLEKNNEIILFNEDKQLIINMINLHPEYKGLEIKETERTIENYQFADTQEYKTRVLEQQYLKQIDEIKSGLIELDLKTIRALRAGETEYLQEYEAQAVELRACLTELERNRNDSELSS